MLAGTLTGDHGLQMNPLLPTEQIRTLPKISAGSEIPELSAMLSGRMLRSFAHRMKGKARILVRAEEINVGSAHAHIRPTQFSSW
jgi:hypothetical protein